MKKAELVFVPAPGMGHLLSTVEVAKLMLDLNSSLSITVLIIKLPDDSKITAYLDSLAANNTSTHIKFIMLPQDEALRNIPGSQLIRLIVPTLRPHLKAAVADIVQHSTSVPDSPRLAGIVFDMFLAPLVDVAHEFGVPSYVFYTSSAGFLGFQFFLQALHDEQNVDIAELEHSDTEFTIPSYVNPVSTKVFPSIFFKPETADVFHNFVRAFREVKGIMVNTFSELEPHAIASLSGGGLPTVYPVGPVLDLLSTGGAHKSSDIMKWLDEQPPSSVVFLCFGSMGTFSEEQVKEIAYALEQSGHRFLWALRLPPKKDTSINGNDNVAEVLPEGFLDRTAKLGKIIGWAPQVAILGHPAIGGFVSHCGWNSTLETLWSGVPIATWPIYSEQQLNAFQLVMELGLGVEIKMDYRQDASLTDQVMEIVSADTIERGIRCLMEKDSDVRKRVKEISEKGRKALMDGGSSQSALCRFINSVMDNMP